MTELQLQAIVNQQGIEGAGESNLDMTMVNGRSICQQVAFRLHDMWQGSLGHSQGIGEEISSAIRWK